MGLFWGLYEVCVLKIMVERSWLNIFLGLRVFFGMFEDRFRIEGKDGFEIRVGYGSKDLWGSIVVRVER